MLIKVREKGGLQPVREVISRIATSRFFFRSTNCQFQRPLGLQPVVEQDSRFATSRYRIATSRSRSSTIVVRINSTTHY